MARLSNIHPGEVLLEEFLLPMEITAYRLSKAVRIPQTRVAAIIKGERSITADTALRFGSYFGTSAKFWMGLQGDYDLEAASLEKQKEISEIIPVVTEPVQKYTKNKGRKSGVGRKWPGNKTAIRKSFKNKHNA